MRLIVNGFQEEVPDRLFLTDLIRLFEEDDHSLIVEINGRFLHPGKWKNHQLQDNDRVEMIHPAFGG